MKQNRIVIFLIAASVISFIYYYFFVDTLSMSQLTGKTRSNKASVLVNLFDLDSGLTRYDVYHISRKRSYWNSRMKEIDSIKDVTTQNRAYDLFFEEMMQDPSIRKIAGRLSNYGVKSAKHILRTINAFRKGI